ncbi:MAG: DNA mismatch repair protein MutS [Sediminicola sp.]
MDGLLDFYRSRIADHVSSLAALKRRLALFGMLRLLVFISAASGVYLSIGNTRLLLGILLLCIVAFVWLVSGHTDLKYERDKRRSLIDLNETEIKVLQGDFDGLPDGKKFSDPLHHYSQDIDLFGKGSIYQYLNRTVLGEGSKRLAGIFTENGTENIGNKQEAVKELAAMPEWRQEFAALATLVKTEMPTSVMLSWLHGYRPFVPPFMRFLPYVFSGISVVLTSLYFLDLISGFLLAGWFMLGLGITGTYLVKINALSARTGKIQGIFHQYQKLIAQLEGTEFGSDLLRIHRGQVVREGRKASMVLRDFSGILGALDQRNNMIFGVVGNGFLLWDLNQSFKLERWIGQYKGEVEQWFKTIAFFDAYNSLGNYAFNHPEHSFPQLTHDNFVLRVQGAAHPLLDPEKRVLNDYSIQKERFFIVTGANMAGKSTFLRTVSLHIVMANMGLPLCAQKVSYSPIKLITSMRTTDSLADGESYFFSELKRLKFVVDQIQRDDYFIVLDEILKGTNSTDKAIGSRKFVEKLLRSRATGIIATHDLSLCDIANEKMEVENHYFDAQVVNGDLYFDYKFKKGICQNMNASFLLKKMQIVD